MQEIAVTKKKMREKKICWENSNITNQKNELSHEREREFVMARVNIAQEGLESNRSVEEKLGGNTPLVWRKWRG